MRARMREQVVRGHVRVWVWIVLFGPTVWSGGGGHTGTHTHTHTGTHTGTQEHTHTHTEERTRERCTYPSATYPTCFLTVSSNGCKPCLETHPHSFFQRPPAGHWLGALRGVNHVQQTVSRDTPCHMLQTPSAGHCSDTHGYPLKGAR